MIDPLSQGLFRRHVLDGPEGCTRARHLLLSSQLGDPEVQDLHQAIPSYDDVGRLDVAVNDAGCVCLAQPLPDLNTQRHGLRLRDRSLLDSLLERLALVAGHDNEAAPVRCLLQAVNGADVRVIEGRRSSRFP